eukprot:scaffold1522_cov166-Amphora_coffeaeformis.AAC.18
MVVPRRGTETSTPIALPLPPIGQAKPMKVSAGDKYYHVYLDDGRILSAGFTKQNQLQRQINSDDVGSTLLPGLCDITLPGRFRQRGGCIKQIVAGSRHVLLLWENLTGRKSETRLFSLGDNTSGQLGTEHGNVNEWTQVNFFDGMDIVDIACGENHSLVLVKPGNLYSFGSNESGQLFVPRSSTVEGELDGKPMHKSINPIAVNFTPTKEITRIGAGLMTSYAVSKTTNVYVCGDGEGTGHENSPPLDRPVLLDLHSAQGLQGWNVIGFGDVSCSIDHGGVIVQVEKVKQDKGIE